MLMEVAEKMSLMPTNSKNYNKFKKNSFFKSIEQIRGGGG